MGLPTFSVLLGNYNKGSYIEKALQAILNQSLPPDEIIIIDDCSTDNSVEIIKQIIKEKPEIRFIQNEKNMGTCYTLNRIVHEATCDYFHLVGTDDFVLPGYYEKSIKLLNQYPQAGLCSAICQCQDIEGNNLYLDPGPPYVSQTECYLSSDEYLSAYIKYGCWYNGTVTLWRREPYVELGGFAPAELGSLTDTYKFFQLALKYGVCFIPEILHTWTVTVSSFSGLTRLNPDHTLNLIQRTEEVMVQQPADLFSPDFVKEFKRRGLISVANSVLEKEHNEKLQTLDCNNNYKSKISVWDRLFKALLKRVYKTQYFFKLLYSNFNLVRFLSKWKWKLSFALKKFLN